MSYLAPGQPGAFSFMRRVPRKEKVMKCQYCDKDATHYAYWHKECPRPVIHACPDHLFRMAAVARAAGEQAQRLHPNLALENEAAIIQVIGKKGKLHVAEPSPCLARRQL